MGDVARVAHRAVSDLFFASSRPALGDSGRDAAREYYVGLASIEFGLEVEGEHFDVCARCVLGEVESFSARLCDAARALPGER